MVKKNVFWYVQHVCLALCLGVLLCACAGIPIGGSGGSATPTAVATTPPATPTATQPAATPTAQPTLASIPTTTAIDPSTPLNANLIANGDAEAGPGAPSEGTIEPIPDWTRHGPINVMQYPATEAGGFVSQTSPGPADRGKNFFWGGGDNVDELGSSAVTSITQTIDLSQASTVLAQGNIQFTLSAWLGDYSSQDDNAKLTIQFVSASGQTLSTASIGPVLAAERNNADGLLQRTTHGTVPATTAKVTVTLTMTRLAGGDNDGSADNLSLVFTS